METTELSFKGTDPGAVRFGNFINYYSFHCPENRISNLNLSMFSPPDSSQSYVCLDIGCNTGELTQALYAYLASLHPHTSINVLGIDIDPLLIKRANEQNSNKNIAYLSLDVMSEMDKKSVNIYLNQFKKSFFDITFCFSVTMWIHLNHGDEGLLSFIEYIKNHSNTIIIETQPWKCYKTAYRRMKRSNSDFPFFKTLQIRNDVEKVIEDNILKEDYRKICESGYSNWQRKVQSYQKIVILPD